MSTSILHPLDHTSSNLCLAQHWPTSSQLTLCQPSSPSPTKKNNTASEKCLCHHSLLLYSMPKDFLLCPEKLELVNNLRCTRQKPRVDASIKAPKLEARTAQHHHNTSDTTTCMPVWLTHLPPCNQIIHSTLDGCKSMSLFSMRFWIIERLCR